MRHLEPSWVALERRLESLGRLGTILEPRKNNVHGKHLVVWNYDSLYVLGRDGNGTGIMMVSVFFAVL